MKGQIWSFDFAVSMTIFISLLVVVLFFWNYSNSQVFEKTQQEDLQDAIITVSDILVRNKGSPENWTAATVQSIGLANDEKILDQNKILNFTQIPYDQAKWLMGIGKYEFYFEMNYANGSSVNLGGIDVTAGQVPTNSASVSTIERFVLFQGKITSVTLTLWTRK